MPGSGVPTGVQPISLPTHPARTFAPGATTAPGVTLLPSGEAEIRGTANIPNFGFYRYEYRALASGSAWRAIGAGDTPVVDGLLGVWDTRLVLPGDYAFRLVVADAAGNAP